LKKTGLFSLLFIFLCAGVWGAEYTWTGNINSDWSNAGNWEESGATATDYPGEYDPNDTVIIENGVSVTLNVNIPNVLDSLTIDNTSLDLDGNSLTVDTLKIDNGATLDLNGASLTVGTLEINNNAILDLDGYSLTVDTLIIDNANLDLNGNSLTVDTLKIDNGTTLDLNGASLTVGTLEINNNANLLNLDASLLFSVDTVIIDNASLDISSYSLTVDTLNLISGNIDVGSGTLTVTGTLTQSAGTIELSDGTIEAGDIIQTGGNINIVIEGTLKSDGAVTQSGGGTITGTDVTVNASQGITLDGANILDGNITLNNIQTGAVLDGDIEFNNTSTSVNLTAKNDSTGGKITINQNGDLEITSLETKADGSIFIETAGAVTQTGTITTGTNITIKTGDELTQAAAAVINADSLTVEAETGITLTSTNKILLSVDLTSNTGDIEFTNDCESTGNLVVTAKANSGNVTITEKSGGIDIDEITAGDIILDAKGDIDSNVSGKLEGNDITVNAGGDITLFDITGREVILNAGYPDHKIFDNPGTVTLTKLTITADLTIWCKSVASAVGIKSVTGNVELNTDNKSVADAFLDDFTIDGVSDNKLRQGITNHYEFGPSPPTKPGSYFIDSDTVVWPYVIPTPADGFDVYITGAITASGDLTINTTTGNIVFEGSYDVDANGYKLNLSTTGGKIVQLDDSKITVDELTITAGDTVTLTQDNEVDKLTVLSAAGDVKFNNNKNLEILNVNADAVVTITVTGDVDISGGITSANAVTIAVTGDVDLSGNITASSIIIEASKVTVSGMAIASTGDISLFLDNSAAGAPVSLNRFNASNGTILVSTKNQDIVYYSSAPPSSPPSGETWTTPLFVEADSASNGNVELQTQGTSNNIYLADVVDSSNKTLTVNSSAGTGADGFIEFFTTDANAYTYSGSNYSHLQLAPGEDGIRIASAVVEITGNFDTNNAKLTLDGPGANGIKAANISLGGISALNNTDKITLEAGGNINLDNIDANGAVQMEAGGQITVSGKVTAYQLTAKAPTGTVSVNAIEINLSNAGNERENAAIYIVADNFVVTMTTANSVIPGGAGGQLCLELNTRWIDADGVVDGFEGMPGTLVDARWHQHLPGDIVIPVRVLYSFTEDSDGDGKLDRIRVQSNLPLNGNFSDFDITLEGRYKINRAKGANGFEMVSAVTGKIPFDYDSFYIYVIENPEIDGENTPLWSVRRNESLLSATGSKLGDTPVENIKPIDTIPPRIAYTLTLPGHSQSYVQMTEPVNISGANVLFAPSTQSVSPRPADQVNLGYLFDLPKPYEVSELAQLPNIYDDATSTVDVGYFQMENIVDRGSQPSVIDPAYPPKYPLNWGYTEYANVNDNPDVFMPPNKLLTVDMMRKLDDGDGSLVTPNSFSNPVIRRVTDVLVSIYPTTGGDNYFVWPQWAKPLAINAGIIWQFDGTAYLEKSLIEENNGIELQARINNSLTLTPQFFWTTADIPADMRNPQESTEAKKVGGLWLPDVLINPLYYYVPMSDKIKLKPADSSSSKLFNFDIADNDLVTGDSGKFEFIFRFENSDMFAARLDAPSGVIPGNWYALIRPFSFDILNIRQQRGGVTILNNVINSDKKETVYIRYHLPRSGRVTVQIYTLDGSLVKSVRRNENREAGVYVDTWDGSNNGGRPAARGMYFVRVIGPDIDEIRKIMVVR
jgi:hypothetical protein